VNLQAALAAYETGKVDFAALLDAERQVRQARLALLSAEVEAQMRLAEIERLIGEDL
jgi:outer membrane protein TolC